MVAGPPGSDTYLIPLVRLWSSGPDIAPPLPRVVFRTGSSVSAGLRAVPDELRVRQTAPRDVPDGLRVVPRPTLTVMLWRRTMVTDNLRVAMVF